MRQSPATSQPATRPVDRVAKFVHDYFLGLLAASYGLAVLAPGPGEWIRRVELVAGESATGGMALSQCLLALLLVIAGVGIDPARVRESLLRPLTLIATLLTKLLAPLVVVSIIAWGVSWLDINVPSEMLLGLAIIAAMPAAASCPAWTQASGGDVAIALGVVIGSTLLGPWAGQFWLPPFAETAGGDPEIARGIGRAVLGSYFLLWVLLPSALGVALRGLLGAERLSRLKPYFRLAGSLLLLLLIYAFAAASLSLVEARQAGEQLAIALALSAMLCATAFAAGAILAKLSRAPQGTAIALVYSVGMHNNGVALLLADTVLPQESIVFLPIISYALVQHVLAGVVDAVITRSTRDAVVEAPPKDVPAQ